MKFLLVLLLPPAKGLKLAVARGIGGKDWFKLALRRFGQIALGMIGGNRRVKPAETFSMQIGLKAGGNCLLWPDCQTGGQGACD